MGLNEVFKKVADIERNATELASHQVDLALNDDAKSLLKQVSTQATTMNKLLVNVKKGVDSINSSLKSANVLANKNMGKNYLAMASKLQQQFLKTEKDLGISLKGSEIDKQISDIFMFAEDIQGSIDDVFSTLNQVGK